MSMGMVLGKFMPPHAGHLHLIAVARSLCDRLTIVVGTQPSEPLDGKLRHEWMQALCPEDRVVHLHRELPQLPEEHPRFWEIWVDALTGILGSRPDRVFAGEDYGQTLADQLGAEFISVPRTEGLPISGSAIRARPWAHWSQIPAPVRAHYCTRVRVVGPESAGKTTLSRALAQRFSASWVAEFARSYLESRGGKLEPADLPRIACGQAASEDALAAWGRPLLITDTDPLLTSIWSDALYGAVPEAVASAARGRRYALTLLVTPHDRWQADPVRYMPERTARQQFYARCAACYPGAIVLEGSWEERTERAVRAIQELVDDRG